MATSASSIIEACLRPPLYATRFRHGFGTLYTTEYRRADESCATTGPSAAGSIR